MGIFTQIAAEVNTAIGKRNPTFAAVAAEVQNVIGHRIRTAVADKDAEWQRVHSYIADVLKDTHVLYAKLARLEGDFTGVEREELERVSERVLSIGEDLSRFSKEFYRGKFSMTEKGFSYGEPMGMTPTPPKGEEAPPKGEEAPPKGEEAPSETEEAPPEGAEIPVVIEGEEEAR